MRPERGCSFWLIGWCIYNPALCPSMASARSIQVDIVQVDVGKDYVPNMVVNYVDVIIFDCVECRSVHRLTSERGG